jgi:recombinational DNA repair ATPase RecF
MMWVKSSWLGLFLIILRRSIARRFWPAEDLVEIENRVLGMDHAELGARYMERHRMSELLIQTVRYHHSPEKAQSHGQIVASVQISDLLIRHEKMGLQRKLSGGHQRALLWSFRLAGVVSRCPRVGAGHCAGLAVAYFGP